MKRCQVYQSGGEGFCMFSQILDRILDSVLVWVPLLIMFSPFLFRFWFERKEKYEK
jgi:hypothetical protein